MTSTPAAIGNESGSAPRSAEPGPQEASLAATASGSGALHLDLARWESNVGQPLSLCHAAPAALPIQGVDVLSWNLAIGAARLDEVLDALRAGRWGGAAMASDRPLVVLAQEAFRIDATVPPVGSGSFHGGRLRRQQRADIAGLARSRNLDLRYAPSMRNGAEPSDRGNAVLATAALGPLRIQVLPLARQRRVAVGAELQGLPDILWVSAHLDTGGRLRTAEQSRPAIRGSGRVAQAAALGRFVAEFGRDAVVGADLNAALGRRDAAYLALVASGLRPATPLGVWRHTFHGPIPLPLDHVLFRSARGRIRSVQVQRLDEHPRDWGARVFGSDHHPLLIRVELNPVESIRPHGGSVG